MSALKPDEIETGRFILKPLHPMVLAWKTFDWTREKATFEFLGWKVEGKNFWRWYRHLRKYGRKSRHCRAILDKQSSKCIGFHIMAFAGGERSASTTIFVGDKSWRGKGVQREVSGAVIDHYFRAFSIDRVTGYIAKTNTISIRNALALGYKLEGTLREDFVLADGTKTDRLVFGMLRSDWQQRGAGSGAAEEGKHG